MMHWIWTILIGFVAGLIAKWVTPGAGPSGFWLTAILGAVVLLVIYHLIARNRQQS